VAFDPRFNVSQAELKDDITKAAALWNDALQRQVFIEGKNPYLPIYVQYGAAQSEVDTTVSLQTDIDAAKRAMTDEANRYATLKTQNERDASLKTYYALKSRVDADVAKNNAAVVEGDITTGRYVDDAAGPRVYIYGFQTKIDLEITLMHEFGHALGLGHVSGNDSIMSTSSKSTSMTLSPQDIAEMKTVCGDN
jgi:hypothetical protein